MRQFVAIMIAIAAVPTPAFAESWLCLTDKSTGFRYNAATKQWQSIDFRTGDDRYIIKPGTSKANVYEVRKFGDDTSILPEAWCNQDFQAGTFLHCKGVFGEFKFNRKTGRFLKSYLAGYWTYAPGVNKTDEGGDTPSIDIGICSAI